MEPLQREHLTRPDRQMRQGVLPAPLQAEHGAVVLAMRSLPWASRTVLVARTEPEPLQAKHFVKAVALQWGQPAKPAVQCLQMREPLQAGQFLWVVPLQSWQLM